MGKYGTLCTRFLPRGRLLSNKMAKQAKESCLPCTLILRRSDGVPAKLCNETAANPFSSHCLLRAHSDIISKPRESEPNQFKFKQQNSGAGRWSLFRPTTKGVINIGTIGRQWLPKGCQSERQRRILMAEGQDPSFLRMTSPQTLSFWASFAKNLKSKQCKILRPSGWQNTLERLSFWAPAKNLKGSGARSFIPQDDKILPKDCHSEPQRRILRVVGQDPSFLRMTKHSRKVVILSASKESWRSRLRSFVPQDDKLLPKGGCCERQRRILRVVRQDPSSLRMTKNHPWLHCKKGSQLDKNRKL